MTIFFDPTPSSNMNEQLREQIIFCLIRRELPDSFCEEHGITIEQFAAIVGDEKTQGIINVLKKTGRAIAAYHAAEQSSSCIVAMGEIVRDSTMPARERIKAFDQILMAPGRLARGEEVKESLEKKGKTRGKRDEPRDNGSSAGDSKPSPSDELMRVVEACHATLADRSRMTPTRDDAPADESLRGDTEYDHESALAVIPAEAGIQSDASASSGLPLDSQPQPVPAQAWDGNDEVNFGNAKEQSHHDLNELNNDVMGNAHPTKITTSSPHPRKRARKRRGRFRVKTMKNTDQTTQPP